MDFSTLVIPGTCWRSARHEVLAPAQWREVAAMHGLSPVMVRIVQAIMDGRKAESVARELDHSADTIRTYHNRLHFRFGVHTAAELVVEILRPYLPPAPIAGISGQENAKAARSISG